MKKYSIKKLFCVMLSGTFLVFAGCNKPKPENTLVPPAVPDVEDGVHDFEVGATEYDLVKDGRHRLRDRGARGRGRDH